MTDDCKFFVPGPTWVRPALLQELARPMIGHRSAEFKDLFRHIVAGVQPWFATTQDVLVFTCSGTGTMEAAIENCVPRRVLVTTCGAFSERWVGVGESVGLEVDRVDAGWGHAVDADAVRDHLASRRGHYDAVTITQNETSTGITNDVKAIADAVHDASPDTLILVDSVSSLAGVPMLFDEWNIDVCFAGSQKCMSLPPGIAVCAVSQRALERATKTPYRGSYFDFVQYKKHADDGGVPQTPSIPHFYALAAQVDYIANEGLENRFERHRAMQRATIERTAAFADLASDREYASPTVTTLKPKTKKADDIRNAMKQRGFTLGGG
ncbi:MAG TPA: alanine--glyoxylate aminotransferase family protein, partial [Thermoanaerobaculia bacterium]|nr:alanine--glyoxylate aminotransferase family protein [Thermoanaerobaculia bacterium]